MNNLILNGGEITRRGRSPRMTQQHYFYALEIPLEAKEKLRDIKVNLQEKFSFTRWVHHQDLHITLAFLGFAEENQLAIANKKLEQACQFPSFVLEINHLGVFGKTDAPRIFWAGTASQPVLHQVREKVYSTCLESGFKLETRPFKPHITLARKWNDEQPFHPTLLEKENIFKNEKIVFQARNIVLYKTHLGKEPKYEAVAKFPLQDKS